MIRPGKEPVRKPRRLGLDLETRRRIMRKRKIGNGRSEVGKKVLGRLVEFGFVEKLGDVFSYNESVGRVEVVRDGVEKSSSCVEESDVFRSIWGGRFGGFGDDVDSIQGRFAGLSIGFEHEGNDWAAIVNEVSVLVYLFILCQLCCVSGVDAGLVEV
jgi:hypothetical protein